MSIVRLARKLFPQPRDNWFTSGDCFSSEMPGEKLPCPHFVMDLRGLLSGTLAVEAGVRRGAEAGLEEASRRAGFGLTLTQYLVDESVPLAFRQLSGVLLKQFVSRHWNTLPDDVSPEHICIAQAEKNEMKKLVPRSLGMTQSKIRTAGAMVVAAIGKWDFPKQWPTLLADLVACLASPNLCLVQGAIKSLDFLATSQMSDDQVPAFVQTVFPALHRVFESSAHGESVKSRAASIVCAVVAWMGY